MKTKANILNFTTDKKWQYDLAKKQERKQQKNLRQDRRNKKDMLLLAGDM
jgi:hypothetical protein